PPPVWPAARLPAPDSAPAIQSSTTIGRARRSPHRPSWLQTTLAGTDSASRLSTSEVPASGSAAPSTIAPTSDRLRILTGAQARPAEIVAASITFLRGARAVTPGGGGT